MRKFSGAVVVIPSRVPVWYVGGIKGMDARRRFKRSVEHEEKDAWP